MRLIALVSAVLLFGASAQAQGYPALWPTTFGSTDADCSAIRSEALSDLNDASAELATAAASGWNMKMLTLAQHRLAVESLKFARADQVYGSAGGAATPIEQEGKYREAWKMYFGARFGAGASRRFTSWAQNSTW
jgi:hypothetical protein